MDNLNISLYEMNKQAFNQIKPYDQIILNKKCKEMSSHIWNQDSDYWMLLCRERNDYTIFHRKSTYENNLLFEALKDCLNNRGYVLDITQQNDGNYEIWIRDFDTKENIVYYLFDYHAGIVEV